MVPNGHKLAQRATLTALLELKQRASPVQRGSSPNYSAEFCRTSILQNLHSSTSHVITYTLLLTSTTSIWYYKHQLTYPSVYDPTQTMFKLI